MKRLAAACLAALCAASAVPAMASDPCPGAAAWALAHPQESDEELALRDAARSFTNPALRAELAERAARDQKGAHNCKSRRISYIPKFGNPRAR